MDENLKASLERRGYQNQGCISRRSIKANLFVREFHLLGGSIRLYRYDAQSSGLPSATWEVELKAVTCIAGMSIPYYLHLFSKTYLNDTGLAETLSAIETRCLHVLSAMSANPKP